MSWHKTPRTQECQGRLSGTPRPVGEGPEGLLPAGLGVAQALAAAAGATRVDRAGAGGRAARDAERWRLISARGYSAELDTLLDASRNGRQWIADLERRERERTGIATLKVGYNKVFGYYIEVTNSQLARVPADYIRKQTLTHRRALHHARPEGVRGADPQRAGEDRRAGAGAVRGAARGDRGALGRGCCCGRRASWPSWTCCSRWRRWPRASATAVPSWTRATRIHIVARTPSRSSRRMPARDRLRPQRHPARHERRADSAAHRAEHGGQIDLSAAGGADRADGADRLVRARPRRRASAWSIASSRASARRTTWRRGRAPSWWRWSRRRTSCTTPPPRSLVILDEIGRGTSTYDGLAIAWAVVEYLHNNKRCGAKTLFATHYHELIELARMLPRVRTYNVAVAEEEGHVVFLHKIVPGGADRSYGIHVAQLAGMPRQVVRRAEEVLEDLEKKGDARTRRKAMRDDGDARGAATDALRRRA